VRRACAYSSFDGLRMRNMLMIYTIKILMLSLSKHERLGAE